MSRSKEIMSFVNKKIFYLQQLEGSSQGNAELAWLRRGIGKNPGEMPDLWGILYEDMPENFIGNTDEPSKEELSCYTALTLFALHQQGMNIASQCMHIKGKKIGQSLRMLSDALGDAGAENRVLKQLSALSTSKNRDEYSYHLRKIVYLLKSEKIPLDYGKLATDLYLLQYDEYASSVKLQWARDFYRKGAKKND